MEAVAGRDLGQFRRWYSQAGTPELTVRDDWDEDSGTIRSRVTAHAAHAGAGAQEPLVIPLAMGLLGDAGNLRLTLEGRGSRSGDGGQHAYGAAGGCRGAELFVFTGLPERPVPSLLRDFSAPVRVDYPYTPENLQALASRDDNGFVRWDAMQQLMVMKLHELQQDDEPTTLDALLTDAVAAVLTQPDDPAVRAELLRLPSESYLTELASHGGGADVHAIHRSRESLARYAGAMRCAITGRRPLRACAWMKPMSPSPGRLVGAPLPT
jgi:aminopeptidase N